MDDGRGIVVVLRSFVTHLHHLLHVNSAPLAYPSTVDTWIPHTQRAYPRCSSRPAFTLTSIGQRIDTIIGHVATDLFAPSIACSWSFGLAQAYLYPHRLPYPMLSCPARCLTPAYSALRYDRPTRLRISILIMAFDRAQNAPYPRVYYLYHHCSVRDLAYRRRVFGSVVVSGSPPWGRGRGARVPPPPSYHRPWPASGGLRMCILSCIGNELAHLVVARCYPLISSSFVSSLSSGLECLLLV